MTSFLQCARESVTRVGATASAWPCRTVFVLSILLHQSCRKQQLPSSKVLGMPGGHSPPQHCLGNELEHRSDSAAGHNQ